MTGVSADSDEIAHADGLAAAARGFLVSALRFYSRQPAFDDRFEGALEALRDVLAAHDARHRRASAPVVKIDPADLARVNEPGTCAHPEGCPCSGAAKQTS